MKQDTQNGMKRVKANVDKCRCEYKALIDKGVCDKGLFGILVILVM